MASKSGHNNDRSTTFETSPPELRKVLYRTNLNGCPFIYQVCIPPEPKPQEGRIALPLRQASHSRLNDSSLNVVRANRRGLPVMGKITALLSPFGKY